MKIYLYSFNKKVNSTKQPTGGTEFDANLKAPSSIINPRLEISADCRAFNYCYIPDFSRYYFINDIVYNAGIWILDLSVDVMATYKGQIGNTILYITRSSVNYDGSIVDNYYPANTECDIQERRGTLISSDDNSLNFNGIDNGYYVLGVQGNNQYSENGVIYYVLTPTQFSLIIRSFYANSGASFWGNLEKGVINSLMNISDFIVSCRWYPVKPPVNGTAKVWLGAYETTITADLLNTSISGLSYGVYEFTIPRHPKASTRGSYLNYAPYSKYELVDNMIGVLPLDPNMMKSYATIRRSVVIDFLTGQGLYQISHFASMVYHKMYQTYINIGIDIPLNGTNVDVSGMTGAVAGLGYSLINGDILGAASSIGNALATNYDIPPARGPARTYIQFSPPLLNCYFMDIVDNNNADKGRPYCRRLTPADIGSGYMEAENPHVSISGTSAEADMINGYLSSGIYYE